jgi:hypothetical protein
MTEIILQKDNSVLAQFQEGNVYNENVYKYFHLAFSEDKKSVNIIDQYWEDGDIKNEYLLPSKKLNIKHIDFTLCEILKETRQLLEIGDIFLEIILA